MRKLIISLALLILPIAYSFGQLSVSGVTGSDGYSVLRGSYTTGLLAPGLSLTGKYARYSHDDISTMSRYAVGASYDVPFIDILSVGAEAGFQPKANQYSNYYLDIYGALNIETLLFRVLPTDELQIGLGYKQTFHSFYNPDYDVDEGDIYAFIYQRTGGFDTSVNFSKAIKFDGDKNTTPPWLDIPNFVSVYEGYLDYSVGASAGYTYKVVRPYAAYNYLKTDNSYSTDDFRLGIILSIAPVSINGSVEWLNFTKNSSDRKVLYSLSAGVKIL